jgi:hypothetical protein
VRNEDKDIHRAIGITCLALALWQNIGIIGWLGIVTPKLKKEPIGSVIHGIIGLIIWILVRVELFYGIKIWRKYQYKGPEVADG